MLFPIIVYIIFVSWLVYAWYQTPYSKSSAIRNDLFASIILPVRNEWPHITTLIDCIKKQTYTNFELILVDDYSSDDILKYLPQYLKESGIQFTMEDLRKFNGDTYQNTNNKKKAIAAGVNLAKGNLIICIDADIEMKEDWLKAMVEYYLQHGKQFFCAPVLFQKQESIWGKYLEVDQINNMAVAEATTNVNKPFLAAGANMAFTKEAWNKVNGYEGVEHIVSGDDMFLLQRIEKEFPGEIGFNSNMHARVYTKPTNTFSEFIHQRVRWFSKSMSYEHLFGFLILMGILLFNLYVVTQILMLPFNFYGAGLILSLKIIFDLMFLAAPLSRYNRINYAMYIPLFSILSALYIVMIALITPFWKYKWKQTN